MKRWSTAILLLALACLLAGCGGDTTSKPEEFVIEDGVLVNYRSRANVMEIPEGVTAIDSEVFSDNTVIKRVVIPDSCASVGSEAFRNCKNLVELTLPDNGIVLGSACFAGCDKLENVTVPASAQLGADVFLRSDGSHVINPCPEGVAISGVFAKNYPTGLVSMRETENGELCLTFTQRGTGRLPVTFGSGMSVQDMQVDTRGIFDVVLRMEDGSEIESSEASFEADKQTNCYIYTFPTTERPKTILCVSGNEVIALDGETWRTAESAE